MKKNLFFLFGVLFLIFACPQEQKSEPTTSSTSISTTTTSTTTTTIDWSNMQKKSNNEIMILTLNMHTYQETNQDAKFNMIAKLINDLTIDLIAFQECAQKNNTEILTGKIRTDNMAYIITKKLKDNYALDYYYVWDWSHYGFSVYEEGVAVISKYPITSSESRYISTNTSKNDITSRIAMMGTTNIPSIGNINFFSAHTHWMTSSTDTEHNSQVLKIKQFVTDKDTTGDVSTDLSIVCGDYNCNAANILPWVTPYNTMVANNDFIDTFLSANPKANDKPQQAIYDTVKGDYPGRIDYIFMKNNVKFSVVNSMIVFKPDIVGTVSDHYGVITKLKKN
ncbi:MAG: hypothetical protein A2086_03805 [Spirochaetes bacterium GWD1_27_9]|nr:MAG: hypothetical protein A2Y34_15205 [Spirochaetes bacterium GWC1_27_15]OHD30669.1 MAG: hypothetical protein A2086_03805 [Spirochaetes bacterium GWD1_27_9]